MLAAAVVFAVPGLVAAQRTPDAAAGRLTLTVVIGDLGAGGAYEYERGVLLVPQNRDDPAAGFFELEFHRFPALPEADPDTPPIIHLNGGPGWPGLASELQSPRWMEENVLPRVRLADFVVVGQRGIGSSGPNTVCQGARAPDIREPYDREARARLAVEAARRCRETWEAEGVDLRGITAIEAAHDVLDVTRTLGYERVQIHGGSFGSHWGMAVLRFHPEIVERALLHGMEGPDHTYDMPGGILAALERAGRDAETSGRFDGRVPPGGFVAGFRAVIDRAAAEPIAVDVTRAAGRDTIRIELDADAIRGLWGGFSPTGGGHRLRGWPADVVRLYEGDYAAAADAVLRDRASSGSLPTAAFFMLDCGSGISGLRLERLLSDPAVEVVGNLGAWYELLCPVWDADLGEAFRRNFDTDIPTVIVHGTWDTSTPIENALELRPHFKNHRFVRVERGSHGALGEAMRASPELRAALDAYIATGDMSGFPETVTLPAIDWLPPPDR
jgi:pimeloyl-ACP methyl ester carboxylesterase